MPQFMLILHERPGDFASLSPDKIQAIIEKYGVWGAQVAQAGQMVDGKKLTEDGGRKLSRQAGKVAAVDGPYAEAKEIIGGVYVIKAKDYDEAVAIASTCPHMDYGRIDVRQVDFMGQPEP